MVVMCADIFIPVTKWGTFAERSSSLRMRAISAKILGASHLESNCEKSVWVNFLWSTVIQLVWEGVITPFSNKLRNSSGGEHWRSWSKQASGSTGGFDKIVFLKVQSTISPE